MRLSERLRAPRPGRSASHSCRSGAGPRLPAPATPVLRQPLTAADKIVANRNCDGRSKAVGRDGVRFFVVVLLACFTTKVGQSGSMKKRMPARNPLPSCYRRVEILWFSAAKNCLRLRIRTGCWQREAIHQSEKSSMGFPTYVSMSI